MNNLMRAIFAIFLVKAALATCVAPRDLQVYVVESFLPFHNTHVVVSMDREDLIISKDVVCTNFEFDCADKSDYEVLESFVQELIQIRKVAYESWQDITVDKKCFVPTSVRKQSISDCLKRI